MPGVFQNQQGGVVPQAEWARGRIAQDEISEVARGEIKARTWTRLCVRWEANSGLEQRGDVT